METLLAGDNESAAAAAAMTYARDRVDTAASSLEDAFDAIYQAGVDAGYELGYEDGYVDGYSEGAVDALDMVSSLDSLNGEVEDEDEDDVAAGVCDCRECSDPLMSVYAELDEILDRVEMLETQAGLKYTG